MTESESYFEDAYNTQQQPHLNSLTHTDTHQLKPLISNTRTQRREKKSEMPTDEEKDDEAETYIYKQPENVTNTQFNNFLRMLMN